MPQPSLRVSVAQASRRTHAHAWQRAGGGAHRWDARPRRWLCLRQRSTRPGAAPIAEPAPIADDSRRRSGTTCWRRRRRNETTTTTTTTTTAAATSATSTLNPTCQTCSNQPNLPSPCFTFRLICALVCLNVCIVEAEAIKTKHWGYIWVLAAARPTAGSAGYSNQSRCQCLPQRAKSTATPTQTVAIEPSVRVRVRVSA